MIWLSLRTAARLIGISRLELTLLGRCGFVHTKAGSIQLKKGAWDEPRFVDRLKGSMVAVGGW
jgi:hypothetical protein